MSHDHVIAAARAFVMESFLYTHPHAVLHADEPLLAAGIIDSMGVIEMVDWISSTWGIYVEDDEITEENLGTLASIARYVAAKSGARAAA
jgi:acyl carrier protein